jgi:hypothetical protein
METRIHGVKLGKYREPQKNDSWKASCRLRAASIRMLNWCSVRRLSSSGSVLK